MIPDWLEVTVSAFVASSATLLVTTPRHNWGPWRARKPQEPFVLHNQLRQCRDCGRFQAAWYHGVNRCTPKEMNNEDSEALPWG